MYCGFFCYDDFWGIIRYYAKINDKLHLFTKKDKDNYGFIKMYAHGDSPNKAYKARIKGRI